MKIIHYTLPITTNKQFQVFPVTEQVEQVIAQHGIASGVCTIFIPHSTAAVRLNDNETMLHQDIMREFYRLVPIDTPYAHDNFESRHIAEAQERSNGHAHLKAVVAGSSETVPIIDGKLALGEHQHILFLEFDGGQSRSMMLTLMGE